MQEKSEEGHGSIDYGDTPAYPGVYEAAATVAGSAVHGLDTIMSGGALRTFQPIGGLHHARRGGAAGFCVFNDVGVVIDTLRSQYGIKRVAYVDIDVHHGDGLFYPVRGGSRSHLRRHPPGRAHAVPGHGPRPRDGQGRGEGHQAQHSAAAGHGRRGFLRGVGGRRAQHLRNVQARVHPVPVRRRQPRRRSARDAAVLPGGARARGEVAVRARERAGGRAHHGLRRRRLQPRQPRRRLVRGARRVYPRLG